jgi:hypothetical protein
MDWDDMDLARLLQFQCLEEYSSSSPDISEEDMALFFNNITVEEIGVVIPEDDHDSFIEIEEEVATMESGNVSDTISSQPPELFPTVDRFIIRQ